MSSSIGSLSSRPLTYDPYGAGRQQSPSGSAGQGGSLKTTGSASPMDRVLLSAQAQAALNAQRNDAGVLGDLLGQAQSSLPAVGDVVQDFLKSMGDKFSFGGLNLKDAINKQLLEPAANAIRQMAGDGKSVAGAGYLAIEGVSVTMRQSDKGIDISIERITLKAAIAYGSDGEATFSGFAAEVMTSRTDLSISTGAANAATGALSAGNKKTPSLALKALSEEDQRVLNPEGIQRTDFGYIPDLQAVLEQMEKITDSWRELLDAALGEDRETDRPALLVMRDRQDDKDATRLKFDLFMPLSQPSPSSPRADSSA